MHGLSRQVLTLAPLETGDVVGVAVALHTTGNLHQSQRLETQASLNLLECYQLHDFTF